VGDKAEPEEPNQGGACELFNLKRDRKTLNEGVSLEVERKLTRCSQTSASPTKYFYLLIYFCDTGV
jgi:hypothetical protein